NAGIVPLHPRDTSLRWVRPAFRSQYLDTPWMARQRIAFMSPSLTELFAAWWYEWIRYSPGGRPPGSYRNRRDIYFLMQRCKEQMLIRRDVAKDEHPPGVPQLIVREIGLQIASHKAANDLGELTPE